MRWFLRLPLCPYCEARFLSSDVRRNRSRKTGICPHCGQEFRIQKAPGAAVLTAAAILILIGVNQLLLRISSMNLLYLSAVTAAGVGITWLLIPYTVRYRSL